MVAEESTSCERDILCFIVLKASSWCSPTEILTQRFDGDLHISQQKPETVLLYTMTPLRLSDEVDMTNLWCIYQIQWLRHILKPRLLMHSLWASIKSPHSASPFSMMLGTKEDKKRQKEIESVNATMYDRCKDLWRQWFIYFFPNFQLYWWSPAHWQTNSFLLRRDKGSSNESHECRSPHESGEYIVLRVMWMQVVSWVMWMQIVSWVTWMQIASWVMWMQIASWIASKQIISRIMWMQIVSRSRECRSFHESCECLCREPHCMHCVLPLTVSMLLACTSQLLVITALTCSQQNTYLFKWVSDVTNSEVLDS